MTQPSRNSIATQAAGASQAESEEESTVTEQHGNETTAKAPGATNNDKLAEPANRVRDYLPSIIAIGSYVAGLGYIFFTGGFNDFTNFTLQKYIFSSGALAALIAGLNFGYLNPQEKSFWAVTDMLWISMAVVSLSGLLNPVENTVLKGEVQTSAYISEGTRVLISNDISLAVKSMCASRSTFQECKDWTRFSKNVDASHIDPRTLYGRVAALELPKLPRSLPSKVYRDAIEKNLGSLKQSLDRGQLAQSRLDDVNIGWTYGRLILLMIALGLRAGKTGADLRNNPPKTPWMQKLKNLSKRFRPKSRQDC